MKTSITKSSCGSVYVEFLIVFGPMTILWLGLAQIGLMYGAHLMVGHACAKAVRAAVVILPDEKEDWGGVAPNTVGSGGAGLENYKNAPSGGRLDAIKKAARIPLAPVSPSLGLNGDGAGGPLGTLAGYLWTGNAVAVTFPQGEDGYLGTFAPSANVTVKITYLFKCTVPLVNKFMCHRYWGAGNLPEEFNSLGFELDPGIEDGARKELDTVDGSVLGALGLADGWRFVAITAQRTLLNQGRE